MRACQDFCFSSDMRTIVARIASFVMSELPQELVLRRAEARNRFRVLADDADQLLELHAIAEDAHVRVVELVLAFLAGATLPKPHRAHQAGGAEAGEIVQGRRGVG